MRRDFILIGCSLLAACGDEPAVLADEPTTLTASIVDGREDANLYPEVGVLMRPSDLGEHLCTGTLIAPDVVLTAAHCVGSHPTRPSYERVYIDFRLAPRAAHAGRAESTLVRAGVAHPDVCLDFCEVAEAGSQEAQVCDDFEAACGGHQDLAAMLQCASPWLRQLYDFQAATNANDVALLFLERPIAGVEPAVLWRGEAVRDMRPGDPMAIVGYGRRTRTAEGDRENRTLQVRVHAMSALVSATLGEMRVGAAPPQGCHGDSGGPAFWSPDDGMLPVRRVAGVASRLFDPAQECVAGILYARVDAHYAWIDQAMRTACRDGTRVACDGGGGLSQPRRALTKPPFAPPRAPRGTPSDSVPQAADLHPLGCAAVADAPGWVMLLAMLGRLRTRARRMARR